MTACPRDVRFTPESGHVRCNLGCPLWANSGNDPVCPSFGNVHVLQDTKRSSS